MARSGGRSQWEREMAAQRREAERQAREQARLAKERQKAAQQRHIESQQRTAELRTSEVEQQARALDRVLTSILPLPALTFDSLKVIPELPNFEPGPLRVAESVPDWNDYSPPEVSIHGFDGSVMSGAYGLTATGSQGWPARAAWIASMARMPWPRALTR